MVVYGRSSVQDNGGVMVIILTSSTVDPVHHHYLEPTIYCTRGEYDNHYTTVILNRRSTVLEVSIKIMVV
jgi:hypothetical protein